MICPKCGFSQPEDYYCANCGVNIGKYSQKKKKKQRLITTVVLVVLAASAIVVARFISVKEGEQKVTTIKSTELNRRHAARTLPPMPRTERQADKTATTRSSPARVASLPEASTSPQQRPAARSSSPPAAAKKAGKARKAPAT
ncbi:MAG: hypothetical protein JRJ12_17890, partial [Deltaproteobacteria bacterium]|nr:hypothetical protein [Deltaproteobacteria bacterium]